MIAMTPDQFIDKWSRTSLTERQAAQEHFIDLCHLLNEPTPAEADPTGTLYPSRILPKNQDAAVELKKRTLTNLYNSRPKWLVDAHNELDAAVAAAYGWAPDISEEAALPALLECNLARPVAVENGSGHLDEELNNSDDED
jgi:hypothetical protein